VIVAVTGHRPTKLGGYSEPNPIKARVRIWLAEQFLQLTPARCILGMALGVDQWAAEICAETDIPFVAAVPFKGQESKWPAVSQRAYRALLTHAASVVVVSPFGYTPTAMQARNEWMVDRCDALLAVWNDSPGGTANCVRYAEAIGRQVIRIPKELI
jgi:uncharacterized phage-like protein YoqJ